MMSPSHSAIADELKKLSPDLVRLARHLGERFPDTYSSYCYGNLAKLAREQVLPPGLKQAELSEYIQITHNATYLRDRFICSYCGVDGLEGAGEYSQMAIDHLVPIWPAESHVWQSVPDHERFIRANGPENLACACKYCNSAKNNSLLGLDLSMTRRQKIEQARAELGRTRSPHRYHAEVAHLRDFIRANVATLEEQ